MAQAYQLIQAQTLTGSAASITFTNIPQTYTDLILKFSGRNSGTAPDITISLNGSSSSFTWKLLFGNGSSAGSNSGSNSYGLLNAQSSATASTFSNCEIYIPNYAGSNNKSISIDSTNENNATANNMYLSSVLWSNTAAITQITLNAGDSFVANTTAYLYGVGGVRATGGTITADSKYTYHTFTSSGTFTALEKIKGAEVLCIAGGGGGGSGDYANQGGGGGGGGGIAYVWGQTLNAGTSFSAVIGSGGAGGSFPGGGSGNGANGSNGNNSLFGNVTAVGGGSGSTVASAGAAGGSGGGAGAGLSQSGGSSTQTTPTGGIGYGNAGGANTGFTGAGGGGGGAGVAGSVAANNAGGKGGDGTTLFSLWGYATSTGENSGSTYFYAGGGGGAGYSGTGNGGKGLGGGTAGANGASASNATANTGGGGGGASGGTTARTGGTGGSGLVIVRYPN